MNRLLDYIRGIRKGKDAHRLEKESMQDSFLYEAMEGFDSVDDDHITRIHEIQQHINKGKIKNNRQVLWKVAIAASLIFVALIGKELFSDINNSGLQAQTMVQVPIDIYVPDNFYKENIAIIAHKNTLLTKELNISVDKDNKATKLKANKPKSTIQTPHSESETPIDIYVPTE